MKTIEERANIALQGVRYRARKNFIIGNFANPFGDYRKLANDPLMEAMALEYDLEMSTLLKDRSKQG